MIEYAVEKKYFRNSSYAIWFLNSIFFFTLVVLIFYGNFGKWILLFPLIFHISPVINSLIKIIKKEKSEIYSVDCIWFNLIMIVLYSILMYKF
ncbi:MAG: hypothetical protein A3A96_01475 [Candidatus Zambryskibacteria bacterium RIFCSPLOWO2_01_FULL_39_39]|uniref:Uncharacterized protein n=1 Tax=Candidatus Zambryskibacteria bacterium RIFCSPLOWO2_01_FULL_39_39 TaxID=1802758 RepID=A0A1G2U1R2_9BACT|nr:MAG: hypothetical protein A2644_03145 [Candidatus Zambryskibacteria bacterium RIFCSPHIGHO2_01_FULL_39_63]OHA98837.1 MAG: hypothetical protein A3F20_02185 [Candidatus Zambryskibacteria bacterium RIFCSPHIGHO2_12_FULL_39_21]OHB02792.1 MAG: hypothetical protein A3A96_01475 [Candidatus Zambryskibacteria bacterium RIFCSPLOWO2_01_FULL_39_39]